MPRQKKARELFGQVVMCVPVAVRFFDEFAIYENYNHPPIVYCLVVAATGPDLPFAFLPSFRNFFCQIFAEHTDFALRFLVCIREYVVSQTLINRYLLFTPKPIVGGKNLLLHEMSDKDIARDIELKLGESVETEAVKKARQRLVATELRIKGEYPDVVEAWRRVGNAFRKSPRIMPPPFRRLIAVRRHLAPDLSWE